MTDRDLPAVRHDPILDRISDAFFALDGKWRFTYLNGRAEQMLDATREQLLGRVIWDEFPETVETQFPEGFHTAMDTQEPVAFEVFHKPLDTWFEARAYPSGSGLTVFLRDVTDRKQRKRELERYETVVETVRDGVFTIDEDDNIAFVNRAIAETLGVDRQELVGTSIKDVPDVATMDAESMTDMGHALDQIRRGTADNSRFEISYVTEDGQKGVADTQLVSLGDGEIAGIVRDVTDRREYERVVRSLHEITPELLTAESELEICSIAVHAAGEVLDLRISGIWVLDEELNKMNPMAGTAGAHEELGGLPQFTRGEGVVWDAFRKDEPSLYDDVREIEAEDTPLRSEIVVPIGEHGVLMAGETTPGALSETDLELATILAANTEAALDRAQRDTLLRRSKATLERQNERLDVVETVLSEDLRDQLAVAARAAREAGAEDAVPALMRARRLADDALELAKGELTVGPRSALSISKSASAAAEVVEGVRLDVENDASLRADHERLVRLFETIFLDARNRAEDGTVTVTIDVDEAETLAITDDAPPLPPDQRENAFDLDRAASRVGNGTLAGDGDESGLGLAVAGEIAQAHGWEMHALEDPDGETYYEIAEITTLEPLEEGETA